MWHTEEVHCTQNEAVSYIQRLMTGVEYECIGENNCGKVVRLLRAYVAKSKGKGEATEYTAILSTAMTDLTCSTRECTDPTTKFFEGQIHLSGGNRSTLKTE